MPKIAKLLESEVITGRISIEVAKDLIGTMLRTRSLGVQGRYGIEGVKKVANSPRKSVEESAKFEASIGITPVLDEITGNTIQLSRTKNGNITLLVSRPKK